MAAAVLAASSLAAEAGDLVLRRPGTNTPAAAQQSITPQSRTSNAQAPAVSASNTLRWRPRTQASPVSVEGSQGIKRTQLLDRLDEPKQPRPAADQPSDELDMQIKPAVREVLQPDVPASPRLPSRMPTLDQELTMAAPGKPDPCPSPRDLKRIGLVITDITPEDGEFPQYCQIGDESFEPRCWPQLTFTWKATALCHKPLYFEEDQLERYGHTFGYAQPAVSMVHFFGTLPILPYKMGIEMPWECMYTLGYYEPGSCAPYIIDPVPLNLRGALLQAGAWTGGVYLIP